MRDIKQAHKRLQLAWEHLLLVWKQRYPNDPFPFLTQVYRTAAEQTAFYAQGRQTLAAVNALRHNANLAPITLAENKHIITNAKVGQSEHEKLPSHAIDIAFLKIGSKTELDWSPRLFQQAYNILIEFDPKIIWGKTFSKTKDLPHYQI